MPFAFCRLKQRRIEIIHSFAAERDKFSLSLPFVSFMKFTLSHRVSFAVDWMEIISQSWMFSRWFNAYKGVCVGALARFLIELVNNNKYFISDKRLFFFESMENLKNTHTHTHTHTRIPAQARAPPHSQKFG